MVSFQEPQMAKNDDAYDLCKRISNEIVDLYIKFQSDCNTEAIELDSSSSKKELLIETITKLANLLLN